MVVYMEREPIVERSKIKSKKEVKPKEKKEDIRVLVIGTDGNGISIVDTQLNPLEIQSVIFNLGREFGMFVSNQEVKK